MPRADLLALTADDLAALTNRGTVKRAERELEEGSVSCQLVEEGGELLVRWSDGIVCRFPANAPLHDASCSSGHLGVSRHVVRSVLAYQKHCRSAPQSPPRQPPQQEPQPQEPQQQEQQPPRQRSTEAVGDAPRSPTRTAPAEPIAWDPGQITDEALIVQYRAAAITRARRQFEQGVLVELMRGVKPLARFLDSPCTIRFLVPGDLRYIAADCDESLLATYVPLAVWAFRQLPAEQSSGIVAHQQSDLATPTALLDELQELLVELGMRGLAGCGPTWPQRFTRLDAALRDSGLVWPAELVADLLEQHRMYQAHDARFDPLDVVDLVGELLARTRAIRSGSRVVPQPLIRGSANDRATEISAGRLIGIGTCVRPSRRVTTVYAFVQDADSGSLAAVERAFPDPAPDAAEGPKSYAELAASVLVRGISLGAIGQSHVLLKSGKRTPSGRLILPRAATSMTVNPQTFAWEQLKPPVAVEDFGQLVTHWQALPPSYLRPSRISDRLCVCPISRVEQVRFNEAQQRIEAQLVDRSGGRGRLVYPFHQRAQVGFEALLQVLNAQADAVRFISGLTHRVGGELTIRPILVVWEESGRRVGLQPEVDGAKIGPRSVADEARHVGSAQHDPLAEWMRQWRFELSELLLRGVQRTGHAEVLRWQSLLQQSQQLGFVRLVAPMQQLVQSLGRRADTLDWEPAPATRLLLEQCLLARVAAEEAPSDG